MRSCTARHGRWPCWSPGRCWPRCRGRASPRGRRRPTPAPRPADRPPSPTRAGQLAARVAVAQGPAVRRRVHADAARATAATGPVLVTVATDGTWRVDIPGGALGGTADVAIAYRPDGLLPVRARPPAEPACVARSPAPATEAAGRRSTRGCSTSSRTGSTCSLDRQRAARRGRREPLAGATGTCFSVEPTHRGSRPPVDPGIFCYADRRHR